MTSSPLKSTPKNSRMNAEGRRTRLNTPMNEYERVQRQFRCHKAPIVKTVTRSACCRYVHISRPILSPGMRFTVGIFLSCRQVRMFFVREIWPDPVAHHLPPSASAEIFTKERFQEVQKNAGRSEKCIFLRNTFRRNFNVARTIIVEKNILIMSIKIQQEWNFSGTKQNFS